MSTVSPLTEASASSLDEYFSRKPPFDSATLARIKQEFRRMREKWQIENANNAPKRGKKAKVVASKTVEIDLFSEDAEETPS